jgi:hypothetical protein
MIVATRRTKPPHGKLKAKRSHQWAIIGNKEVKVCPCKKTLHCKYSLSLDTRQDSISPYLEQEQSFGFLEDLSVEIFEEFPCALLKDEDLAIETTMTVY